MTARRLDITTAEYLADPAPEPSLSSSIAALLLDRSPRHAHLAHPRLGGVSSPPTPAQDRGSLVHRLVLGRGATIVAVDAEDWRTRGAREEREAARSRGAIPALARDVVEAQLAADAILYELTAAGIFLDGESEVAILWQEGAANGPIWCRGMLDHIHEVDGRIVVYDLKTTRSAHPQDCVRSAISYSYDIQAEAYTRAVEMLRPEYAGRVEFRFVFAEVEPPYGVTVGVLDALMRQRGCRRWRDAVETWSRCMATGQWSCFAAEPVTLWSPTWLYYRESEAAEARGEDLVL